MAELLRIETKLIKVEFSVSVDVDAKWNWSNEVLFRGNARRAEGFLAGMRLAKIAGRVCHFVLVRSLSFEIWVC